MTTLPFGPAQNSTNDADLFAATFARLLAGKHFIKPVQVRAVRGTAPDLVVDVLPLVSEMRSADLTIIDGSAIFNLPVWRLQRGNSAIIMDPVVGDIGLVVVADHDTTVVRKTRKVSVPGCGRTHSLSDAIYLGGFLNPQPTQFIEFTDSTLHIHSPNTVNITCKVANITATDGLKVEAPQAHFTGNLTAEGDITDHSSEQKASLKMLRDRYNQHRHPVSGVQSGGSTINSSTTDATA